MREGGGRDAALCFLFRPNQLTAEHRSGTNAYANTYTYDPLGNRLVKSADTLRTATTYDAANQIRSSLSGAGRVTYTYDANGNKQVVREPGGDRMTYAWDYENQNTLVRQFGHDDIQCRSAARLEGVLSMATTNYVWDPLNDSYLMETDAIGDTTAVYTQEPSRYGGLISPQHGTKTSYFQQDNLGSTWLLTDDTGAVTDTFAYDAWGNEVDRTGMTETPFRWVGANGYYFDVESYYIRARSYSPQTGVWLSPDPDGFVDGINLYKLYLVTNGIDPSGIEGRDTPNKQPCYVKCKSNNEIQSCYNKCDKCWALLFNWAFDENKSDKKWLSDLPSCPCKVDLCKGWERDAGTDWYVPFLIYTAYGFEVAGTHIGVKGCFRLANGDYRQQCCYSDDGELVTTGFGAGTPDKSVLNHGDADVTPWACALLLDAVPTTIGPDFPKTPGTNLNIYLKYRPPNAGKNCKAKHPASP